MWSYRLPWRLPRAGSVEQSIRLYFRQWRPGTSSKIDSISSSPYASPQNCSCWVKTMSWAKLLADKRVKVQATSLAELTQLRAVVTRDTTDAQVPGLSADRRFACLYSAALQLRQMVIAYSGYRVSAIAGHHHTSFEALELAIGPGVASYAAYFDICRRKGNLAEYDSSSVVTETEVSELLIRLPDFEETVEEWIRQYHPQLGK